MVDSAVAELDAWLSGFILQLEPKERRSLLRQIARTLRKSNQQRIAAQVTPDGTAFTPRSAKSQAIRKRRRGRVRKKMFTKLRLTKHLKANASADEASVGWRGRTGRIAKEHHYGLRARVNKNSRLKVDYPARELLGISTDDEAAVRDLILAYLDK